MNQEEKSPQEIGGGNEIVKDAKLWATLCHLSALAGCIIPIGHIIGPLVVWLIKRNEFPFVDDQDKEALNFQITMTIFGIIAFLLIFIVIGFFLLVAVGIFDLVMVIIASIKANNGIAFRYPLTIRFLK